MQHTLATPILALAPLLAAQEAVPPDESVTGSVEVVVVDGGTGEPIEGAEVFLVEEAHTPLHGLFEPEDVFRTDAEGRATASYEDARFPRIVARAEGYGVRGESFRVGPVEVELIPEQPITVEVLDFAGRPVSAAHVGVAVGCGHTPDVVAGLSGEDGRVFLRGVADHDDIVDLYVAHPALSRTSYDRVPFEEVDGDGVAQVVVGPGWTLSGALLDADGQPMPGAFIGYPSVHRGPWCETDAHGNFTLIGMPTEPVELTVRDAAGELVGFFRGARPGVTRTLRVGEEERDDAAGEGNVHFVVRDETGAPAIGIPVTVWAVDSGATHRGTTGAAGQVQLTLPAGRYRAEAGGAGSLAPPTAFEMPVEGFAVEAGGAVVAASICDVSERTVLTIVGAPEGAALELRTADGRRLELDGSLTADGDERIRNGFRAPHGDWAVWSEVTDAGGIVRRRVASIEETEGGAFVATFGD